MTEERKQELRELLKEATKSLVIRLGSYQPPLLRDVYRKELPVEIYRKCLQERWPSYSEISKSILYDYRTDVVIGTTTSKLLDFIRVELSQFINEDRILHASFVLGGTGDGFHLDRILQSLLKNTIARGIDEAVLSFDRCTKNTQIVFHRATLLEGIKLETSIQLFEGIRLVPIPDSQSDLPYYLPRMSLLGFLEKSFFSQTLLIIDYSVSPIFHKPSLTAAATSDEHHRQKDRFQVEVSDGNFPIFDERDFFWKFIPALSLACNSPVKTPMTWDFLTEDEFFNENHDSIATRTHIMGLLGNPIEVSATEIARAKCLYRNLHENPDLREKLRIPIDRWIKSKADRNSVDKMIDLGIAFEALYLSDVNEELTFRLAVRAAWYLGKDKADREKLLTKFGHIYRCRSKAVHSGKLEPTVKFGEESVPVSDFIEKAQDLCRQSILKILEDGKFPDWNSLILGGAAESDVGDSAGLG